MVPTKALSIGWDGLDQTPELLAVRQWAESFLDIIDPFKAGQFLGSGLLLTGPKGRGKTTAAALALAHVMDMGYLRRWTGWFVSAGTLEEMLSERMSLDRLIAKVDSVDEDMLERWKNIHGRLTDARNSYKLLVLDDIGRERSGGAWTRDFIESLIRARYDRAYPTILTSNLTLEELTEAWGAQFVDFLRDACKHIEFTCRGFR
jgi:DNA replication protein DnaC